jgi:hypothetical protein
MIEAYAQQTRCESQRVVEAPRRPPIFFPACKLVMVFLFNFNEVKFLFFMVLILKLISINKQKNERKYSKNKVKKVR